MGDTGNSFHDIFPEEIAEINRRRASLGQPPFTLNGDDINPSSDLGLVGLSLSGGGIRSASFNLGVLLAAVETGVLNRIDYLSTVSGGGYIGASASVTLDAAGTALDATTSPLKFPLHPDCTSKALDHIRHHVNYLAPGGFADLAVIILSLIAGMIAQAVALLPYPVLSGWLLAVAMGYVGDPKARRWDGTWLGALPAWLTFLGVLLVFILVRSKYLSALSTTGSVWRLVFKCAIALIAFTLTTFLPTLVTIMQDLVTCKITTRPLVSIAIVVPIATIVARALTVLGKANVRRVGLLLAALLGPFVILTLVIATARWAWFGYDYFRPGQNLTIPNSRTLVSPEMLSTLSRDLRETILFVASLIILYCYSAALDANASSMHAVYRNALSRTFLFQIAADGSVTRTWQAKTIATLFGNRMLKRSVDRMYLSELSTQGGAAPYHLICAAINTPSSSDSVLRNRGADSFMFSKRFVGSPCTGYCRTESLERAANWLDIGTAIAASAAAVSAQMGVHSALELSFLIAVFNARLGVWIPNPRFCAASIRGDNLASVPRTHGPRLRNTISWLGSLLPQKRNSPVPITYLLREFTGRYDETGRFVNISDGGHIENVGFVELLKRGCSVIFVSDAEADPEMKFDALTKACYYAESDLNTKIKVEYELIRKDPQTGLSKVHFVFGKISYPDGSKGLLVYLKSSLTGDEDVFVRNRPKDDKQFPHTPTSFQFFTDAHFQSYKQLGQHIATEAFEEYLTR